MNELIGERRGIGCLEGQAGRDILARARLVEGGDPPHHLGELSVELPDLRERAVLVVGRHESKAPGIGRLVQPEQRGADRPVDLHRTFCAGRERDA